MRKAILAAGVAFGPAFLVQLADQRQFAPLLDEGIIRMGARGYLSYLARFAFPAEAALLVLSGAAWWAIAERRKGILAAALSLSGAALALLASPYPHLPVALADTISRAASTSSVLESARRHPLLSTLLYAEALRRLEQDRGSTMAAYEMVLNLYRQSGGENLRGAGGVLNLGHGKPRVGLAWLSSRSSFGMVVRLQIAAGERERAERSIDRLDPGLRAYFRAAGAISDGRREEARAVLLSAENPKPRNAVALAGLWCSLGELPRAARILRAEPASRWLEGRLAMVEKAPVPVAPLPFYVLVLDSADIALALRSTDPGRARALWEQTRDLCFEAGLPHLLDFYGPLD